MKRFLIAAFVASQASFASAQSFTLNTQEFVTLFNKARVGQPTNTPWAGSYWAYANSGIATKTVSSNPSLNGVSPAQKYDAVFGTQAEAWERQNHSCDAYTGETKASCQGWWGHCNAWAAAAIKEKEPRQAISKNGRTYNVADQKALLTELWMSSGSLFEGHTDKSTKTGSWVFNPNSPQAMKVVDSSGTNGYQAFWDVSPRTFFLIFTNYVGLMKQSVVVDRFTGDEVWNQPIVGYRILPIREQDLLAAQTLNGTAVYPVKMRVKIYWANDGVHGEHVSKAFSIASTNTTEAEENLGVDYTARLLKFKLWLNRPIRVISETQIESEDGQPVAVVGQGIWDAMENPGAYYDIDQTHPDFIWQPTQLASGGSKNPHIVNSNVRSLLVADAGGGVTPTPPPAPGPIVNPPTPAPTASPTPGGGATTPTGDVMKFTFLRNSFGFLTMSDIKFKLQNAVTRENISPTYFEVLPSGNNVILKMKAPGVSEDTVKQHLINAGMPPL